MISKKWLRYTLGTILGGAAGLSLTATILPFAMSLAGLKEEFMIRWDLGGYAAHCVLAFAFGGWLIARVGRIWTGPLLLGGVGLACGSMLGMVVYPGETSWLLFMAVAAGAYGSIGGLLLGHVLQAPAADEAPGK
jgi:MFS family permease